MGLVACGSGGPRDASDHARPIRVEFWHGMGARTHQELLLRFADEFMALHPDIEIAPVFQGTYGALYQKLIAAITARRPPAMAMMFESWTTRLHHRKRLVAVQDFVDGPAGFAPEELTDFYPAFLEDSRWAGRLVTMPFNKSAFVLQYNKNLLRRAGHDSPPQTWDELRETAIAVSALTADDGRPCVGLLVRPQLESFTTLFYGAGGAFLDSSLRPMMNAEPAAKALGYLTGLINEGAATVDEIYPASRFGSGSVGMFIYSSAAFPFNDRFSEGRFEWGAAPVPAPAGASEAQRRTLFQGMNVGLLAGHSPEVEAAAWTFLKFMLEPQRAAAWSMATGYCPVRRSALDAPEMRAYLDARPQYAMPLEVVARAAFEPKPDYWESWRAALGEQMASAIQGLKSPADALADAQAQGEDALRYDNKFASAPAPGASAP